MTQDQLRVALENAVGVPEQAMRDAVANAAELAPAVIAEAQRMAAGRFPLPPEERLLRFGLHALAVARETSACQAFLALLRRHALEVDWLFGENRATTIARLLLGLFDGDDAALRALAADRETDGRARAAILGALARLVWEGRASREAMLDLLDQIDRDKQESQDSFMWYGWQSAVMLLGLTDWIERAQSAVDAGRDVPMFDREVDRQDWLERIQAAAEHPEDPQRFIDDEIMPFDDPVDDMEWHASEPTDALNQDELRWLDVALWRRLIARRDGINFEGVDGYLTGLAAGPASVPAAKSVSLIWGEHATPPHFDTPEHDTFVTTLLDRHLATIQRDLANGETIEPWIDDLLPTAKGGLWAQGYATAVQLYEAAWQPLIGTKRLAERLMLPLAALTPNAQAPENEHLSPRQRSELVEYLPDIVAATWAFWRHQDHPLLDEPRARPHKIGRNEPCPCGSGKKYKRCCGAAA
jgi:uncharacterized protein